MPIPTEPINGFIITVEYNRKDECWTWSLYAKDIRITDGPAESNQEQAYATAKKFAELWQPNNASNLPVKFTTLLHGERDDRKLLWEMAVKSFKEPAGLKPLWTPKD